ncbi:MAG: hypothetical protein ACI8W8_003791, partial [Rhodothermales bacterium]
MRDNKHAPDTFPQLSQFLLQASLGIWVLGYLGIFPARGLRMIILQIDG